MPNALDCNMKQMESASLGTHLHVQGIPWQRTVNKSEGMAGGHAELQRFILQLCRVFHSYSEPTFSHRQNTPHIQSIFCQCPRLPNSHHRNGWVDLREDNIKKHLNEMIHKEENYTG